MYNDVSLRQNSRTQLLPPKDDSKLGDESLEMFGRMTPLMEKGMYEDFPENHNYEIMPAAFSADESASSDYAIAVEGAGARDQVDGNTKTKRRNWSSVYGVFGGKGGPIGQWSAGGKKPMDTGVLTTMNHKAAGVRR